MGKNGIIIWMRCFYLTYPDYHIQESESFGSLFLFNCKLSDHYSVIVSLWRGILAAGGERSPESFI